MNDRFKFRVWDKENNKMFIPPRHFNYSNVNGTIVCIESFCQYDGFHQKRIIKEFNDATLMQCTGLKDKNGKLIYEGDIVRDKQFTYVFEIEWDEDNCGFSQANHYNNDYFVLESTRSKSPCHYLEIIGNIYENAGLLKE